MIKKFNFRFLFFPVFIFSAFLFFFLQTETPDVKGEVCKTISEECSVEEDCCDFPQELYCSSDNVCKRCEGLGIHCDEGIDYQCCGELTCGISEGLETIPHPYRCCDASLSLPNMSKCWCDLECESGRCFGGTFCLGPCAETGPGQYCGITKSSRGTIIADIPCCDPLDECINDQCVGSGGPPPPPPPTPTPPSDCGNEVIDLPDEQCDGNNLGGATCDTLELGEGELACTASCKFDISDCEGFGCDDDYVGEGYRRTGDEWCEFGATNNEGVCANPVNQGNYQFCKKGQYLVEFGCVGNPCTCNPNSITITDCDWHSKCNYSTGEWENWGCNLEGAGYMCSVSSSYVESNCENGGPGPGPGPEPLSTWPDMPTGFWDVNSTLLTKGQDIIVTIDINDATLGGEVTGGTLYMNEDTYDLNEVLSEENKEGSCSISTQNYNCTYTFSNLETGSYHFWVSGCDETTDCTYIYPENGRVVTICFDRGETCEPGQCCPDYDCGEQGLCCNEAELLKLLPGETCYCDAECLFEKEGCDPDTHKCIRPPTPIPDIIKPTDGSEVYAGKIVLEWFSDPKPYFYHYQVDIQVNGPPEDRGPGEDRYGEQETATTTAFSETFYDFWVGDYLWRIQSCCDANCEICTSTWNTADFSIVWAPEEINKLGLVPCALKYDHLDTIGFNDAAPCGFEHLFWLLKKLFEFLLFKIGPVIFGVLIIALGLMLYFSLGTADTIFRVRSLLKSTLAGYLLILFSWFFVTIILALLGHPMEVFGRWYEINL